MNSGCPSVLLRIKPDSSLGKSFGLKRRFRRLRYLRGEQAKRDVVALLMRLHLNPAVPEGMVCDLSVLGTNCHDE